MLARTLSFTLAIALAAPAVAHGQAAAGKADVSRSKKQARIRERIRTLRTVLLVDRLALDETAAAKLAATLARFDDQMEALAVEGATLRQSLEKELRSAKTPNDKILDDAIDAIFDHHAKKAKLERDRFDAARKVLSARQAAEAILIWPQIEQAIRQRIRGAMEGRARARRGQGEPVLDPFADGGKTTRPRGRKKGSGGCDEVSCVVDPGQACCTLEFGD